MAIGGKLDSKARRAARRAKRMARRAGGGTSKALGHFPSPSTNPMTNLIISDIILRGSGRLMRRGVERAMLGAKYEPEKAKDIIDGRSVTQMLIGTALARLATKSVPGAALVGGGLLVKTLYDRVKGGRDARREGERDMHEMSKNADGLL